MNAYKRGVLAQVWGADHSWIKVQLSDDDCYAPKGAYRLIRDYDGYPYIPPYESVAWYEVYKTYTEAEAVVQAHKAELDRVAALSDLYWSVEQIEHTIDRWVDYNPEERIDKKQLYFDWILAQWNPEEIETRLYGGGGVERIQWKKWKNKRWMDIVL